MPNPKDITDPTTAMNMALALLAKAFKLNYSTPTNNNQMISSNPRNRQIAQLGMNMGQDKQMQMVGDLDEIEEVNANCILMANLQQASTSGTQTDKAPVYDSDGSAEVHDYENYDENKIFNMYTELLEPIPEQHQVPQNDNNFISENLAIEVEKANSVNRKLKETNADLTTELARFKKLVLPTEQKMALGYQNLFYLKQAQKKQQSLYDDKLLLEKHDPPVIHDSEETLQLAQENQHFENCIIKKENEYAKLWNDWYKKCDECKYEKIPYNKAYNDMQQKIKRLQAQLGDLKGKSKDTSGVSDTLNPLSQKLENENVKLEFQVLNYARENAHLKARYKNLFGSISMSRTQTKTIIASLQKQLHNLIYENAKLRAQLFKKFSVQKDIIRGTSKNTKFVKQSILGKPPMLGEIHALSKPITSNLVPTPQESKVVKNDKRTVNVVAAREKVGSPVVQKSGIQCFNCREFRHFAKECRKPKRVKDSAYHKEKMLLCKQAKQGVSLQVEQYDWLADTDEEVDEQELEAHYSYMAKIHEVPTTNSGTDSDPVEQVKMMLDIMCFPVIYNIMSNLNLLVTHV
nr:hypothetical protein [Tanacetum cinerariifolium]